MKTNNENKINGDFEGLKFHPAKSGSSLIIKNAILQQKINGCWIGQAPAFYRRTKNSDGQPTLAVVSDSHIITKIFQEIASRQKTPAQVWLELKADEIYMPRNTFYKMLRNWVYTGKVSVPAFDDNTLRCWVKGLHKPLIDEATFLKVQEVMSGY